MAPPASGPNAGVSSTGGMLVSTARVRRAGARRRGVDARPEAAALDELGRVAVRRVRVVEARVAAFLRAVPVAFLVWLAARRVVVAARRRVEAAREPVPRAICRACFARPSIRFRTALTSARVLARLTCVWRTLIAVRAFLSASLSLRSTWRRRSGGTRLSASLSARRPALTARPTSPVRLDVRFLFAMHDLHEDAARSP